MYKIYGVTYTSYEGMDIIALFTTLEDAEVFKEQAENLSVYGYGTNEFKIFSSPEEAFTYGAADKRKNNESNSIQLCSFSGMYGEIIDGKEFYLRSI